MHVLHAFFHARVAFGVASLLASRSCIEKSLALQASTCYSRMQKILTSFMHDNLRQSTNLIDDLSFENI